MGASEVFKNQSFQNQLFHPPIHLLVQILKQHTEIFFQTDNLIFNLGSESWLAAQTKKMRNEPS